MYPPPVAVATPVTVPVGTPVVVNGSTVIKNWPLKKPADRTAAVQTLLARGWPPGLTETFKESIDQFPVRYIVIDNSGSMQASDGSRLIDTGSGLRGISCTRWQELGDVVKEMAEVVGSVHAETHFHLLNESSAGQFFVLEKGNQAGGDLASLQRAMQTAPRSTTPLTEAVQRIIGQITPVASQLRANGQQAAVVLCTDGLPNDPRSFLHSVKELQRLPVWLVVRLCTNEDSVVDFWNDLDKQLERPLETLDDVQGEAREVYALNRWLTYAPSLHLARTIGLHDKNFDLIEEQPLMPFQVKSILEMILGCGELPVPEINPDQFIAALEKALATLPPVYNPISGRMAPWVDVNALKKHIRRYGGLKTEGSISCACM